MNRRSLQVRTFVLAVGLLTVNRQPTAHGQSRDAVTPVAMTLDVDATDAPMKIIHATMSMPAKAGAMSLFYPKWIPGEHMAQLITAALAHAPP